MLLLLEPCSNHAQLVHALSRHMDTAAVAASLGPTEEKLKGRPVPLSLLMLSITGGRRVEKAPHASRLGVPESRLDPSG